jgi:hypothetical protein
MAEQTTESGVDLDDDTLHHPDDPHQQAIEALKDTPIGKMRIMVLENAQDAVTQRMRAEKAEAELRHWIYRAQMAENARNLLLQILSPNDKILEHCDIPNDTSGAPYCVDWHYFREMLGQLRAFIKPILEPYLPIDGPRLEPTPPIQESATAAVPLK